MQRVAKVGPEFWVEFTYKSDTTPLTSQALHEYVKYMRDEARSEARRARLELRQLLDIRKLTAEFRHAMHGKATHCPVGWIRGFCSHEHHFGARDRQSAAATRAWREPTPGVLYARWDFGDNSNCPLGPSEDQDWWFATARLSITNLNLVFWRAPPFPGAPPSECQRSVTYLSTVLEKSTSFVLTCFEDAFGRVMADWCLCAERIAGWQDTGNHFRTWEMMWWFFLPHAAVAVLRAHGWQR